MNSPDTNAFLRGSAGQTRFPHKDLAGLLAPLRAELTDTAFGCTLAIDPMHASDALRPWRRLDRTDDSHTLVVPASGDPDQDTIDPAVVDHDELADMVAHGALDGGIAVLIDGPVEPGDVRAIRRAIAAGRSPLEAELRAVASMRVERDRTVRVDVRDRSQAALFVAEDLRQYLAAVCSRRGAAFELPETRLIECLLERTGRVTVRPIETEIYSTFVDIGINTDPKEAIRPADASVIYDLHGNSWHGDFLKTHFMEEPRGR